MLWITIVLVTLISTIFHKLERVIGFIAFVGIGYLVGTPNYNYNGDAVVYLNSFMTKADNFESGYNWLTNWAGQFLDYSTFRLYSSLIVYILLFCAILLFTKKVSLIALFYSISMFPFDNEQVRNGMASLFILLGAYFLVKWERKGIIPAILIIYFGSYFHSLALIFLLLPLLWMIKENIEKNFKIYFIILSGIAIASEVLGSFNLTSFFSSFLMKFGNRNDAATNVVTVYNDGVRIIPLWFLFYFITLIMIFTFYKINCDKEKNIHQFFLCSIILWTGSLILLTISFDYLRILRVVSFFYLFLIASLMTEVDKRTERVLFTMGLITSLLLFEAQFLTYGMTLQQWKSIIGLI